MRSKFQQPKGQAFTKKALPLGGLTQHFNKGLTPAKKEYLLRVINKDKQEAVPFQYQDIRIDQKAAIEGEIE